MIAFNDITVYIQSRVDLFKKNYASTERDKSESIENYHNRFNNYVFQLKNKYSPSLKDLEINNDDNLEEMVLTEIKNMNIIYSKLCNIFVIENDNKSEE